MAKKRAPASGEENAICGYQAQYEFSAYTLFSLMQDNRLDAVSICDHAAGILDDLVVFSRNDLIAHQIKSQRFPEPFRLRTLLIDNRLIADIAAAWNSLRKRYCDKTICISYVLPGYPSTNDKNIYDDAGHSAELLSYLSNSDIKPNGETLLGSKWAPFIRELITASGLNDDQFFEMFCKMKFYDQGEIIKRKIDGLDNHAAKKAKQIKNILPEIIASRGIKEIWPEQELLRKLGWNRTPGQRAIHNFPLYPDVQINSIVEEQLKNTINNHTSGYISLIGAPGTGKSTTLQRGITSPAYRVARYLAFLPDQRHGLGRAEATDFLNDITLELNKLGFTRSRFIEKEQLSETFLNQLEAARDHFVETGQKTLIVIDGLDHIQREERPNQNLLNILPLPQSIPEGVLIILGSQFLNLDGISPSIIQQASNKDRCIEMAPLTKFAIFNMAQKAELPSHVDMQTLFDASNGHPLVARYYIERLLQTSNKEEAHHILTSGEIGTTAEQMYERVWSDLAPDENAKHVLALLARADNSISPIELSRIVNDSAVENIRKQAGFLLAGIKDGKWRIFHNSFRVFLWRVTRQRFGQDDPATDKKLYSELAINATQADKDSDQHWLALRYLYRAGDKETVKDFATPDLFRRQLQEFRPDMDIYTDLRLAYGTIENTTEVTKFVQLMMAEKEIDYRLEAISQLDLVQTFIIFGEQDRAFELALANAEQTKGACMLVDQLFENKDFFRARTLFEAIEPVSYFLGHGNKPIHNPDIEKIFEWIERAHRFRSIDNILEIVDSLPFDEFSQNNAADNLKFFLARGILYDNPAKDVDELCIKIGLNDELKTSLIIYAALRLNNLKDYQKAKILLEKLHEQAAPLEHSNSRACAVLAFELGNRNLAVDFLSNVFVRTSKKFRDHNYSGNIKNFFSNAFSVAWLSEHLGKDVLFEPSEEDDFQNKIIQKIIQLGRLKGKLEISSEPENISVSEEINNACLFLAHATSVERPHAYEPLNASVLAWFARELVEIASLNSDSALRALEAQVEQLYTIGNNRISRFSPFRLAFAKAVYKVDGDQEKAVRRINFLQEIIQTEYTPHSAVELRVDLATALAEVGAIGQAKAELALIHNDTCGYWLAAKKEPQYVFWNEAFERACRTAAEQSGEFSTQFAQFVIGLSNTEGSGTGHRITYNLLKNAARAPSECAGIISRLIETDLINWADMVAAVLHGIALQRPDLAHQLFTCFNRLVIPFVGNNTFNVIEPLYQQLPDAVKVDAERDFIRNTQLYADTTDEVTLLARLREMSGHDNSELDSALKRAEIELTEIRDKGPRETSSSTHDREEEKLKQVQSLPKLIDASDGLAQHGKRHVDYQYANRAKDLLETASKNELLEFLDKRPIVLEDTKFVISATSRLMDLGVTQKADELYALSEKSAQAGSWSDWLGGEKIALQKLRKKRKGKKSEAEGFTSLVGDFANGRASARMVLPDISEIFDIIVPEAPWNEIWLQVQDHLSIYREYSATEPVRPLAYILSHEDILAYIFRTGFSLLCNLLTARLRDSLISIARQAGGLKLFDIIAAFLVGDEMCQREISAILWKLIEEPTRKEILIKYARILALSNDFVVANVARNILLHFEIEFDAPLSDLAPFYDLAILGDENSEIFKPPAGVKPGSKFWIDDPWYWTAMLETEIKWISRASGIEIEAIRRRCAEFMRRSGGEDAFGPPAEESLVSKLKNLDLRFTYRRMMPHFALKALGQVVEELVRAEHLDLRIIQLLWSNLGGAHFENYCISKEPRPDWMIPVSLPKMDHWKIDAGKWLSLGPENTFLPSVINWFVLAEQSEGNFIERWKTHSMVRTALPDIDWVYNPDEDLYGLPKIFNFSCFNMHPHRPDNSILCTIDDRAYGDLPETTLTINNLVLKEFGWRRSKTQPFEIYAADDELVAKTLIWMDGAGYPDNNSLERSSSGQVVLISESARMKIESKFGKLEIKIRVIQKYRSSGSETECTYFNGIAQN